MNILEEARAFLEQAEYETKSSLEHEEVFYFEDPDILGFVAAHRRVVDLMSRWEEMQDTFLRENASNIRKDPQKVWSIYSVHITEEDAIPETLQELRRIEEDFRGTRKIAIARVRTKTDVRQALLPLMPLQNLMSLSKRGDMGRLKERIAPSGGPLRDLTESTPPSEIVAALSEKK